MCFTLQTWIFYSTYNLTHLGRDTFIYGLLITHQSLGGLFMRIFVCLDRTHKHKHSIAQSPPFSKTTGHFLWAPCVWIHSWNQMAENDLNSFFKHSTPGGFENIAEFESGTRTYKSNYTGLHSELKRGTRSFVSLMRFRATFTYLLQFLLTTRVKQIPFLIQTHCVSQTSNAIPQITAFPVFTQFFRIKLRNTLLPLVWFSDWSLICQLFSSTICSKITSLI